MPQTYHVADRCPYCGSMYEANISHELSLVKCADCDRTFVAHAVLIVEARTMRIEGESTRNNAYRRTP